MHAAAPAKKEVSNVSINFDGLEVKDVRPVMTDEEFEAFCLRNPKLRIEQDKHGNIIVMSPVSYTSGNQENEVNIDLGMWNRKTKLGKTFSPSTMFILPDDEKRMPDAAWITLEKHQQLSSKEKQSLARIVPDFIVEVRSPSDVLKNLKEKMSKVWIANGVRLAWLIDPLDEVSWVYRQDGSVEEVRGFDKKLSGEDVLPGFEFDLSILLE